MCMGNKSNAGMGSIYRSKRLTVVVYLVGRHVDRIAQ